MGCNNMGSVDSMVCNMDYSNMDKDYSMVFYTHNQNLDQSYSYRDDHRNYDDNRGDNPDDRNYDDNFVLLHKVLAKELKHQLIRIYESLLYSL
jgi:hypothetical protein